MVSALFAERVHSRLGVPSVGWLFLAAFLIAYAVVLIRTAWMCDDAFITLRTVDNFVRGYGLVWNPGERVQAYTHPLWLFVLSAPYAITREPFYTTLALSMLLAIATALLLLWQSRGSVVRLALVGLLLIGSKAFVDYSTSGLENPLSYLLLTVCLWLGLEKRVTHAVFVGALGGLLMLNRLDLGLLVGPLLAFVFLRAPRQVALRMAMAAMLPVAGWMLFALIYYGFPFPNTFYAKQSIGIPRHEYVERGLAYLIETAVADSATLVGIAAGVIAALWQRKGEFAAAVLGIALYLCYVIWIGGDFMAGRMLSVPLAGALSLLAASKGAWEFIAGKLALIAVAAATLINRPYLLGDPPLRGVFDGSAVKTPIGAVAEFGLYHIADERAHYRALWLLPALKGEADPLRFERIEQGRALARSGAYFHVFTLIGMVGYYAGQGVEIVDPLALSDAFLARIGLHTHPSDWRLAHVERPLPDGYLLTRFSGENHIRDPQLAARYEQLQLLTRGPLFAPERLSAIFALNAQPPLFARLNADQDVRYDYYLSFFHPRGLRLDNRALDVVFSGPRSGHRLFVRADGSYRLELRSDRGRDLRMERLAADDGVLLVDLEDVDAVRVVPLDGQPIVARYVLVSPAVDEEGHPVRSSSVALNLSRPQIFAWAITDPNKEPLWVTQPSLPLLLNIAERRPHVLQVSVFPLCASGKDQALRLKLNGRPLAAHTWANCGSGFGPRWETTIVLNSEQVHRGWNLLEVEAEYGVVLSDVAPETGDGRVMYVGFNRLWLEPAR